MLLWFVWWCVVVCCLVWFDVYMLVDVFVACAVVLRWCGLFCGVVFRVVVVVVDR